MYRWFWLSAAPVPRTPPEVVSMRPTLSDAPQVAEPTRSITSHPTSPTRDWPWFRVTTVNTLPLPEGVEVPPWPARMFRRACSISALRAVTVWSTRSFTCLV